jgi:hypothetical protein
VQVRVICPVGEGSGICASAAGGATGGTGSGGGGASGGTGGSDGSTGGTGTPKKEKAAPPSYVYVVKVTLDGKTYKQVVSGDGLPNNSDPLVIYAGDSGGKKAIFLPGDGIGVSGVTADPDLGSFELAKGESATLTDTAGATHKLTLKSISKVKK